jgi:hypothetical protein
MSRPRYSAHERALVREQYACGRTADIAAALGISEERVRRIAAAEGVKKRVEVLADMAREHVPDLATLGRGTRFRPGQRPWNNGVRYQPAGQSVKSRFAPGARPHNEVPIGTLRVVEDGRLEIKYSCKPGPPGMRWMSYARHVWQQANGPVPEGYVVGFLPGRASSKPDEITLDALELVSRSELMQRNSVQRLPEQLRLVVQARGVLTREIRQRMQDQDSTLSPTTTTKEQ